MNTRKDLYLIKKIIAPVSRAKHFTYYVNTFIFHLLYDALCDTFFSNNLKALLVQCGLSFIYLLAAAPLASKVSVFIEVGRSQKNSLKPLQGLN